ncbi:MAG: Abi family protein [Novosphingobium sp.]|uniref:Abi family protein n=1 Tax=Novosphingobium sp. TaxID=1874826 RepID=UPI0032BDABAC
MSGTDWKSYADQLQILKDRGLLVGDDVRALIDLERIGYYCLSGYWYPFRQLKAQPVGLSFRQDDFIAGSKFEGAVALYVFDKNLRLLALDALERIERAIRVDVAHLLGAHDCFAQHNPALFHGNFAKRQFAKGRNAGKTEHDVWLERYAILLLQNRKQPFVAHNLSKHNKLPIWVAIEILDFGALSRLFAGMQFNDKQAIAAKYGLASGQELEQWLRSLNLIRNVAAHHSRMWNMNVLELSPVPQYDAHWQLLNNARPFMYFCIIQKLMLQIVPTSSWGGRFKALVGAFPEPGNKAVSGQEFGLVAGWEQWQLWA